MSTQYNKIQKPYDELRKTTIGIVERVNIREIVLPFIKDAEVLDFACGTGFYSHAFIRWGARRVLGIDISSAMIDEAKALAANSKDGANISFMVADCSTPTAYPGGPFDIVFGAWFLNYAPNKAALVDMYRNIFLNLKPGGCFVAVTPPPTNEPSRHYEKECKIRPLPTASGGLFATTWSDVEDGIYFHLHSDTPAGDLDFDNYHLRQDVWEAAAREAGFQGELKWSTTYIPEDFMANPSKYGEESSGRASTEELATYAEVPHYGLLFMRT